MKWAALVWLVAASLVRERAPVVSTRGGLVRGSVSIDHSHYRYFGVPYATVGDGNRFQAPLPAPQWDGILDVVDEHVRCPQRMVGTLVTGAADCLKLHVYVPARRARPLPVMVYIHGGCFFEGTGANFLYGGDYFVDHGVILVAVNYRLNVEGFLCLGIEEAPGNAGLKDQIAALKWIKENIAAFGGDPDNVTLFGESAGAVSTSMLILSPAAHGLFHRAILQSGSSLAPWALQHDPIKTASDLVKQFGHETKDPKEIYSILKTKSIDELIGAIKHTPRKTYITSDMLFVPCVERAIPGVEPVLTRHPVDVIQSGNYTKVPMIIGFNDREGIYFVAQDYGLSVDEVDPATTLQPDLEFPSAAERNATAASIGAQYFGNDSLELMDSLVDLYSDVHFKFPALIESQLYAATSDQPIYYYLFQYSGLLNFPKLISVGPLAGGASHADELFYMFRAHSIPLPQRTLERQMTRRMLTLWTNFAKYSDPTPAKTSVVPGRWSAGSGVPPRALVLSSEPRAAPLWDERAPALRLWNETYARYRRRRYGFGDGFVRVS